MLDEPYLFYKMVDWEKRLEREKSFFKKILEKTNPTSGDILDLGCGIGHHLIMFAQWGYKGLGIDFSESSIEIAVKRTKEEDLEHLVKYIHADMKNLQNEVGNRKFDLIVCLGNSLALFPLEEREEIINQALATLKENGKFVLQIVNYRKHLNENLWLIKPKAFRDENGLIRFFVRIIEWENEEKQQIKMYVQRLYQDSKNPEEFIQSQKVTNFHVLDKTDFYSFEEKKGIKVGYFGDFSYEKFEEDKSNDLIIVLEKL